MEEPTSEPVANEVPADNSPSFDSTSLPGDLADEPSLRNFDSVDKLAQSYVHLVRKMGAPPENFVQVPNAGESWDGVYQALGRPEEPSGYSFDDYENQPGQFDEFRGKAHQLGLTQNQAEKLLEISSQEQQQNSKMQQQHMEQLEMEGQQALMKEWPGKEYDKNMEYARRAFGQFATPELLQFVENTRIGDHPEIIKMMSNIGKSFAEHQLLVGTDSPTQLSPVNAQQKIDEKFGDKDFNEAYLNKEHPNHDSAVKQMSRLFQSANE